MSAPNLAENFTKTPELHKKRNPVPEPASESLEHEHGSEWIELARIGFVALAAAAVWFRVWEPFPHVSIVGIAATLIGGYPIFKEAWENIVERKMTMELSMTIAIGAALAIGQFFRIDIPGGMRIAGRRRGTRWPWDPGGGLGGSLSRHGT